MPFLVQHKQGILIQRKLTKRILLVLILFSTFLASGLKNSCKAGDEPFKPRKDKVVSKAEDSTGAKSSKVIEGFSLVIKTEIRSAIEEEKGYFLGGESIKVLATITNETKSQLVLVDTDPLIDFQFVVNDSGQKAVSRTRFGKRIDERANFPHVGRVVSLRVPAGGSREFKFYLSRQFDLSLSGTYSVQATRKVLRRDGSGTTDLVSDVLVFEIR